VYPSVKIGTIQRRLAWPLRKDDTQNREDISLFFCYPFLCFPYLFTLCFCFTIPKSWDPATSLSLSSAVEVSPLREFFEENSGKERSGKAMEASTEFQVVILSGGPGSRMYPLTTEIAKPLLPIANRPMISYQLELLERAGFAGSPFFAVIQVLVVNLRAMIQRRLLLLKILPHRA